MHPFFSDLKNFFLDTVFPKYCFSCGQEGSYLCQLCELKLPESQQVCIVCKKASPFGKTHNSCYFKGAPESLSCFFDYRDKTVSELIIKGKYFFVREIFTLLGETTSKTIQKNSPETYGFLPTGQTILVPVPLNKFRLNWRGFNQAQIFAETLGNNLGLKTLNLLERTKLTKTQKNLKKQEREKNLLNAFKIRKEFESQIDPEKQYILVDDVTTTGYTLLKSAEVLHKAGLHKIAALCLAKD